MNVALDAGAGAHMTRGGSRRYGQVRAEAL